MPDFEKEVGVPLVADFDEILTDDEIDAVFICSPTDTHAELIKKRLKRASIFSVKNRLVHQMKKHCRLTK